MSIDGRHERRRYEEGYNSIKMLPTSFGSNYATKCTRMHTGIKCWTDIDALSFFHQPSQSHVGFIFKPRGNHPTAKYFHNNKTVL